MYSEVLHYYVHKKTNPLTQTQGGSATTLIKPKKKNPAPTQNAGRGSPSSWVRRRLSPRHRRCCRCRRFPMPVVLVVPATSPCRPWPYCSPFPPREQLLAAAAVGGAVVVVVLAVLVLVFLVIVVCAPVSSPGVAAPRLHPASSCSRRRLGVLLWC